MEQQISERVSMLETDVAVIKSNYVRKDEIAELLQKSNAESDKGCKMESSFDRVGATIERSGAALGRCILISQISVAAMFIAAIKYL